MANCKLGQFISRLPVYKLVSRFVKQLAIFDKPHWNNLLYRTCIIIVGVVTMNITHAKWSQRPSSIGPYSSTHDPFLMQFKCLIHCFSQPTLSCDQAVWHSQGLTQNRASTVGMLSHSYGWACHFDCHWASALPLAITVFMLLWELQVDFSHKIARTSGRSHWNMHSHSN